MRQVYDGWAENPDTNRNQGIDLARRAIEVAENDPDILVTAALALAYFGEDIGAMMSLVDRALALNPSFARGWFISGVLRLYAGQPDLAIEHVETSLRLSPRARIGSTLVVVGQAYFVKHRFEEAAAKLLLCIQEDPGSPVGYGVLAACYGQMGRVDEARSVLFRMRALTPRDVPTHLPWRNPENRELYLSGLRLAMGETA